MINILKFGGSSLSSSKSINKVVKIIHSMKYKNDKKIVVVSALYGITNSLVDIIDEAKQGNINNINNIKNNILDKHLTIHNIAICV